MKYETGDAFRAAIEARLRHSTAGDMDLARQRRMLVFDRFLARLAVAEDGAWILKGGAALEFRMPARARATRDIDLAVTQVPDPVGRLLDDLAADPFGDFFAFRITQRRELPDFPGRGPIIRLSLESSLAGRVFERFVVDLVQEATPAVPTERVEVGRRLSFAELPVVELAVIDLRTHWAEKLSAYLRRYEDRPNTRVKDLVDLVLMIEHGLEPDAALHSAVSETFNRRDQFLPAVELPSMADAWADEYQRLAEQLALTTTDAVEAQGLLEAFWHRAAGPPPDRQRPRSEPEP